MPSTRYAPHISPSLTVGLLTLLKLAINQVQSALANDLTVEASLFRADHDRAGGGALSFIQMNEVRPVAALDCRIPQTIHVNRAIASVQQIDGFVRLFERFVVNGLVINVEIEISLRALAPKNLLKINCLDCGHEQQDGQDRSPCELR